MAKPFANIGDILLPERKLWDGSYAVALVNTTRGRRDDRPKIKRLAHFLSLGEHAGILQGEYALEPSERVAVPKKAALTRVRALRDVSSRIVGAGIKRQRPSPDDVEILTHYVDDALAMLKFRADGNGYTVVLDVRGADRVLHLAALSLGNLLLSGDVSRLRACTNKDCDFAFVDRSPGPRRRWCDKRTCGAVEKVRLKRIERRKLAKEMEQEEARRQEAWRRKLAEEREAKRRGGQGDDP